MAAVVGLTFLFGFGNVLNLTLRLGVPARLEIQVILQSLVTRVEKIASTGEPEWALNTAGEPHH